jgi:hypothetical protein
VSVHPSQSDPEFLALNSPLFRVKVAFMPLFAPRLPTCVPPAQGAFMNSEVNTREPVHRVETGEPMNDELRKEIEQRRREKTTTLKAV